MVRGLSILFDIRWCEHCERKWNCNVGWNL